jgi:hypothetical protein
MAWSKLVDMELDDEDKMDACCPIPCPKPDYPYGLRISLTHKELEKLGLEPDCEVGDMIDIRCFAVVRSVSLNDSDNGQTCCIELQIEKMAVEDEMNESED